MAVTLLVELGLDDGPTVALGSVTWTDVTADVRNWSVSRGRTSELSGYSAGSATVVFGNSSRKYDQSNSAGVFYDKIKPRRRLRITLTAGAVTAAVFTGYITDWQLDWPEVGLDATATVSAADAFDLLATRDQPGSAYAAAVLADSPDHYWPMQESDGVQLWPLAGDAILLDRLTSLGYFTPNTTTTLPVGQPVMMSSGTSDFDPRPDDASGVWPSTTAMEAWVYDPGAYLLGSPYIIIPPTTTTHILVFISRDEISVQYSDADANKRSVATIGNRTVVAWPDQTGRHAHVAITFAAASIKVYLNGTLHATIATEAGTYTYGPSSSGGSIGIYGADPDTPPEASIGHVAIWNTSTPSAARILAHYEAGTIAHGHPMGEQTGTRIGRILDAASWPTADREITDPGATVVGQWLPAGASVLAGCRECETVEQGAFFINAAGQATFRSRNQLLTLARCVTSQATIGDDAAETPVKNPLQVDGANLDFVRNAVTVTYQGGSIVVKDATSITSFGELEESVTANLLESTSGWVARQLANYRLRLRKDPATRVPAVTAQVLDDVETHLATLIPLELCDRVTVNRRPSGGTGSFSQACHIQGIRWGWSAQGSYTWQAYLAPAVPSYSSADYLLIGDATYGKVGSTHTAVY